MKKYILKKSQEEVKIGDILKREYLEEDEFGYKRIEEVYALNDSLLKKLIKEGIIEEKGTDVPTNIEYYYTKLSNKMFGEGKKDTFMKFIEMMRSQCPVLELNYLAKAIAVEMDKAYPDHITKCSQVWVISAFNFRVEAIENIDLTKGHYQNIALFRSYEDAALAVKILKPIIDRMQ